MLHQCFICIQLLYSYLRVSIVPPFPYPFNTTSVGKQHRRAVWQMFLLTPCRWGNFSIHFTTDSLGIDNVIETTILITAWWTHLFCNTSYRKTVAVVVEAVVHARTPTGKVQDVGVLATVSRTAPIVAVAAYIVQRAVTVATAARSREKQPLFATAKITTVNVIHLSPTTTEIS